MDEQFENIEQARAKLRQLLNEYKRISKDDTILFNPQNVKSIEEAEKKANSLEKIIVGAKREARGLGGAFSQMLPVLQANVAEISKINNATNTGKRAYSQLVRVVRELADEEASITNLSLKQIKVLDQRAQSELKQLKASAEQLSNNLGLEKLSGLQLYNRLRQLKASGEITEAEFSLLRAKQQNFVFEKLAVAATESRLELERKVLDNLKLTGGALTGIGNLASSLGLSGFAESISDISTQLEDDIRKKVRESAEAGARAEIEQMSQAKRAKYELTSLEQERLDYLTKQVELGEELSVQEKRELDALAKKNALFQKLVDKHIKLVSSAETLVAKFKALGNAAKEFLNQLTDPLFIIGSMVKSFNKLDEAATKFQRTTGQNAMAVAGMNTALVSSVEVLETMSQFAADTGRNLGDIISTEELGRVTVMAKQMGIGAEGASKLALNMAMSNTTAAEFTDQAFDAAKSVVEAGGAGINLGQVLQDASQASGAVALNLGNNPAALARATAEAQRLGLNLQQMQSIAEGMLDFESSIQAELEAQLLTGKNINFARAREAAMMGDMETLASEIGNQEGIINAFATKNVAAQMAAAKAVGISRDELAKLVVLKQMEGDATEEQVAAQLGMSKQQVLQITAQEKFSTAMQKVTQSLAPLLEALVPVIDVLAAGLQVIGKMFGTTTNEAVKAGEYFGKTTNQLNNGIDAASEAMEEFGAATKVIGGTIIGVLFLGGIRKVYKLIKGVVKIVTSAAKGIKNLLNLGKNVGDVATKTASTAAAKTTAKTTAKTGAAAAAKTVGKEAVQEGGEAVAKKAGAKGLAKLFGKASLKRLPFIGAIAGLGFAVDRLFKGDYVGAAMEAGSGALSLLDLVVPGLGFGLGTAMDLGIAARDMKLAGTMTPTAPQEPPAQAAKGGITTQEGLVNVHPQEAIIPLSQMPQLSMEGLNAKFDEMIEKLDQLSNIRGDVYIDGYNAGQAIFASSNNLPS